MNRRNFLKALAAAGIATAVPLAAIESTLQSLPYTMKHSTVVMGYGHDMGIATEIFHGKQRWRHAISFPALVWEEATEEQRAELWARVDAAALEHYELNRFAA